MERIELTPPRMFQRTFGSTDFVPLGDSGRYLCADGSLVNYDGNPIEPDAKPWLGFTDEGDVQDAINNEELDWKVGEFIMNHAGIERALSAAIAALHAAGCAQAFQFMAPAWEGSYRENAKFDADPAEYVSNWVDSYHSSKDEPCL